MLIFGIHWLSDPLFSLLEATPYVSVSQDLGISVDLGGIQ